LIYRLVDVFQGVCFEEVIGVSGQEYVSMVEDVVVPLSGEVRAPL
jgi:hypothetical protein